VEMDHEPGQQLRQRLSPISRLKVHLRLIQLAGSTYRIVTLRPATKAAFSTNYFHNTWHLLSDLLGCQLLARLLWGLSYQRQPGTMVLIHRPHLLPTPFEAERSDPFLLIPSDLTRIDKDAFRKLKSLLSQSMPRTQTIRWLTFGLDTALKAWQQGRQDRGQEHEWTRLRYEDNEQLWQQERMGRCGGFIYYSAPPPILRQQALMLHSLRVKAGSPTTEMNYHFLADKTSTDAWCGDGEVQIFADYRERVAAATQARLEILPLPNRPVLSETLQEVISQRRDQIKHRKRLCRQRTNRNRR
jgi:hypothetical protein